MTVDELIAQLKKIPGDYTVEVHLSALLAVGASDQELKEAFDNPQAISAFISSAAANDEEKLAYVFGAAYPPD